MEVERAEFKAFLKKEFGVSITMIASSYDGAAAKRIGCNIC